MSRTDEEKTTHYVAMGDSVEIINAIIDGSKIPDATTEEKKERVTRSVGYLKHQKDTYSDWGDKDFTVIDAAITAADNFTS